MKSQQSTITPAALPILERNLVPDFLIRLGIQRELEMELVKINKLSVEEKAEKNRTFAEELKTLPIAIQQDKGEHNNNAHNSKYLCLSVYSVQFISPLIAIFPLLTFLY